MKALCSSVKLPSVWLRVRCWLTSGCFSFTGSTDSAKNGEWQESQDEQEAEVIRSSILLKNPSAAVTIWLAVVVGISADFVFVLLSGSKLHAQKEAAVSMLHALLRFCRWRDSNEGYLSVDLT